MVFGQFMNLPVGSFAEATAMQRVVENAQGEIADAICTSLTR